MRNRWIMAVTAGVAIGMAAPSDASAQMRGRSQQGQEARERARAEERARMERARIEQQREVERERLRREREQRARAGVYGRTQVPRNDERYRDRDDRYDDRSSNRGPAFCRSGAGHPVHGRQWCVDKGFGLGSRVDSLGDIIFRDRDRTRDRDRDRRNDRNLSRSVLEDILGSVVLGRIESQGRRFDSGATTGEWLQSGAAQVLQIYIGRTPIARLTDRNRDGRVDDVAIRR